MLLFRNKKGFTLIEIVLVLVLLGILASTTISGIRLNMLELVPTQINFLQN